MFMVEPRPIERVEAVENAGESRLGLRPRWTQFSEQRLIFDKGFSSKRFSTAALDPL